VRHLAAFAVLTVSLVAPIGAARALLGLVMNRLARQHAADKVGIR